MALTDVMVRNARPKEVNYKIGDGNGLWLQINTGGSKLWRYRYSFLGKESVLSLGKYPEVSLAEAREQQMQARKLLRQGLNPSHQRKQEKRAAEYRNKNTFAIVAKEWHTNSLPRWTPRHARGIWRRLEIHILPTLGKRPIEEISTLEILDVLKKCEKAQKRETTHRALESCRLIFRYAVLTQRIKINPATDLKGVLQPNVVKHFPSIGHNQLPEFIEKLEVANTTLMNKLAVKMLLLTFVRQGEMRVAKWTDFDLLEREWRIRPETTKMRELHIVPLSKQAIYVLSQLREISGDSAYLFPSRIKQKHPCMSENTINHILHRMGYKEQLVAHGFRSLASTILNENGGFRPDVIERQLAHKERNKVRAAYNRAEYMPERRDMMQWWGDFIDGQSKSQHGPGSIIRHQE